MFWRKKKQQVEKAVDDVAIVANDLAGKTMIIGTTGVLLLVGAAVLGAATTYYVTRKGKTKAETKKAP